MRTDIKYIPFGGGLNTVDSHVTMPSGMLSECLNFEQVFGHQGYSRISGFEAFGGTATEPHKQPYSVIEFGSGSSEIAEGNVIAGSIDGWGIVIASVVTSGSWAGADAAGYYIAFRLTGDFVTGETVSGATVTADSYIGSLVIPDHTTYQKYVFDYYNSTVGTVSASVSAIRGIAILDGVTYVQASSTSNDYDSISRINSTRTNWEGTSSFTPVLRPSSNQAKLLAVSFSGTTGQTKLYGCDGVNWPWVTDGITFSYLSPIYGSQATSTTSITIGTGSHVFTAGQSSRSWTAGQTLVMSDRADGRNRMIGTVTSYSDPTLTVSVSEVHGSGTVADWLIDRGDNYDKPFDMVAHSDHLFLAYPGGQLQTSNLGDPLTYTSTASLFGLGDSITGMSSLPGGALAVWCENTIDMITGTDKTTWVKNTFSKTVGGGRFTCQSINGIGLSYDSGGVISLQATLSFGDFQIANVSRRVTRYINDILNGGDTFVGSRAVKSKNQYRLYTAAGKVLIFTIMSPNAVLTPDDVSVTRADYGIPIISLGSGEIGGEEYLFIGSIDGMVYRENVGTSFSGNAIPAVIRTPFWSLGYPSNKKRFRKVSMEMHASHDVTVSFRELYDYDDGLYSPDITATSIAGGGTWDISSWDTFVWSSPVQSLAEANVSGVGRNMAMLIWHESDKDEPFDIQGVSLHYSVIGMAR